MFMALHYGLFHQLEKNYGMAYLPGERPLVNPWLRTDDSAGFKQSYQTDDLCLICLRGVSGPGSSFVEWGEEGHKTKLIAVVKGMKINENHLFVP